jgi:hypothetical protein
MSQTTPEPMFVWINDPNARAQLRQLRFTVDRHYTRIAGCDAKRNRLGGFNLRIPTDQIEVFTTALRKFHAGELGRMALDAELRLTTVVKE